MNNASAENGTPVELFQILKDDAVKVLHSICQQIWKTQQWLQDWKRSVFIPIPKKGNDKECSNYQKIALISHVSKVLLKILQASLQQYMNHEIPDVQAGFRQGRGTRDQTANIHWIIEKAIEFQKIIYFCSTDYTKAFDYKMVVWGGLINSCEKKRSEGQRRKGKIFPFECRVPKNIQERDKKVFLSNQCKEIEENNYFCFFDYAKDFVWITNHG